MASSGIPTIEEERAALARLLAGFESGALEQAYHDDVAAIASDPAEIAAADQFNAAWAETAKIAEDRKPLVTDLIESYGLSAIAVNAQPTARGRALLLGLIYRCLDAHACVHAAGGERPLFVAANARVISCQECLPRFLTTTVAAALDDRDAPAAGELCDICLEAPSPVWFHPFTCPYGPALVVGHACPTCLRDIVGRPT